MKISIVLLLLFASSQFPQKRFLDLRGFGDSLNNTTLTFREIYADFYCSYHHIYKFNPTSFEKEVLYSDSFCDYFPDGYFYRDILDYINYSSILSLSSGVFGSTFGGGYYTFITDINRIEHQWPGFYYPRIKNLEIARQDGNKLYAAVQLDFSNYAIFKSTNGGIVWDTLGLGNYLLKSISSLKESIFFSSTIQGELYKSNNGGIDHHLVDNNSLINWEIMYYGNSHTGGHFKFFYDIDNQHIYTVATNTDLNVYYLMISENMGENWQINDSSSTPIPIYIDIDYSQSGTIYKCAGTTIYLSTDYGESFDIFNEITSQTNIRGIYKKPATDLLYIITENVLYEVTSSSVTPILTITEVDDDRSGLYPLQYGLSQNYPNPFNPTTKIKYQLPEISFVTLKVYDVLGNEITTLVNEEKPAGSYEVEFEGTGLPSGIYFYQLRAGNFVETKKMVLLR